MEIKGLEWNSGIEPSVEWREPLIGAQYRWSTQWRKYLLTCVMIGPLLLTLSLADDRIPKHSRIESVVMSCCIPPVIFAVLFINTFFSRKIYLFPGMIRIGRGRGSKKFYLDCNALVLSKASDGEYLSVRQGSNEKTRIYLGNASRDRVVAFMREAGLNTEDAGRSA